MKVGPILLFALFMEFPRLAWGAVILIAAMLFGGIVLSAVGP